MVERNKDEQKRFHKEQDAKEWISDDSKKSQWIAQRDHLKDLLKNPNIASRKRDRMDRQLAFLNFHLERDSLPALCLEELSLPKRQVYFEEFKDRYPELALISQAEE